MVEAYSKKRRAGNTRKRKRFIFLATEGHNKTETLYFKQFSNQEVQIKFAHGSTTDPVKMSKELIKTMKDEDFDASLGDLAFCLIDGDNMESKNPQISEATELGRKNHFQVILSNPCFEVWFMCHFCYTTKRYKSGDEVISDLKKYIPEYEKNMPYIRKLIKEHELMAEANAIKLREYNISFGRREHTVDFMPSTEMYKVIQQAEQRILDK